MTKPIFRVKTSVNNETDGLVAVYLRVRDGEVAETKEVEGGSFTPIMIPTALFWESSC